MNYVILPHHEYNTLYYSEAQKKYIMCYLVSCYYHHWPSGVVYSLTKWSDTDSILKDRDGMIQYIDTSLYRNMQESNQYIVYRNISDALT